MQVHPRDELAIFLALAEPVYTCGNKFSSGKLKGTSRLLRVRGESSAFHMSDWSTIDNPSCEVAKNMWESAAVDLYLIGWSRTPQSTGGEPRLWWALPLAS